MSVVVVSVDGDGGGCFVSSCGWCAMFLNNNRDATLIFLKDNLFFWIILSSPFFVIERPRSCGKNEERLVCVFAEDFEDVKKCQKANESGDRTVLLATSA